MKRSDNFIFIEERLTWLATRLSLRGKLNILDLHLHSENFYIHFLNQVFDWKLENANLSKRNISGIDLIDRKAMLVVQVSATTTRQKIESALAKMSEYRDYRFKFLSICEEADKLRKYAFANPFNLAFAPEEDILDLGSLLAYINTLKVSHQIKICELLRQELKTEPGSADSTRVESNLAAIIDILAKESWSNIESGELETLSYDIDEKITWNQIESARPLIDDYKVHYARIDKIYSDFDRLGSNRSLSILNGIRSEYVKLHKTMAADDRFFAVIDRVVQIVCTSSNYRQIPAEELLLCVQILVVDAFIRCKIFENPMRRSDAGS